MTPNPCVSCGACCAHFRATFYWGEAEDATPEGVPLSLCEDLTPMYRVMKGTNSATPRCVALLGDIGQQVACSIYDRRASACRNFVPSWEDGVHNPRCDDARRAHGMAPLTPEYWESPLNPDLGDPLQPAA